jgi:hypothetical protein
MEKGRLEAFSDAVIAIVMTIMVLELKVPHEATWSALRPLTPVFFSYAITAYTVVRLLRLLIKTVYKIDLNFPRVNRNNSYQRNRDHDNRPKPSFLNCTCLNCKIYCHWYCLRLPGDISGQH